MDDMLCQHLEALLNGFIPYQLISKEVGILLSLPIGDFEAKCKDITHLMLLAFGGQLSQLTSEDLSSIGIKPNTDRVQFKDPEGKTSIPDFIVNDKFLLGILSLPGDQPETHRIWAGMMRLKTCLEVKTSNKKLREAYVSICSPSTADSEYINSLKSGVDMVVDAIIKRYHLKPRSTEEENLYQPLHGLPYIDKSRYQYLENKNGKPIISKRNRVLMSDLSITKWRDWLRHPLFRQLYDEFKDEFIASVFTGVPMKGSEIKDLPEVDLDPEVPIQGISAVPEFGLKDRIVCVPCAIAQCVTYAASVKIKDFLKPWPCEGVFSHLVCQRQVQDWLIQNDFLLNPRIFKSYDLKSFTDRFPYQFQKLVLQSLFERGFIDQFDFRSIDLVVNGPVQFERVSIHYAAGTPMGTYPSFPLASLAHGILATILWMEAHPHERLNLTHLPFKVIGDDFVCKDELMFPLYEQSMERLGVLIQTTKCLQSSKIVNICSKIVTKDDIYEQKKLKTFNALDIDQAVVNYKYYNPILLNYNENVIRTVQSLMNAPEPYGLGDWATLSACEHVIWSAIKERSLVKPWIPTHMNELDYRIILERTKDYPTITGCIIPSDSRYEPITQQVISSFMDEIISLTDKILERGPSIQEKVLLAERVNLLFNVISERLDLQGLSIERPPVSDYHLKPNVPKVVDPKLSEFVEITLGAKIDQLANLAEETEQIRDVDIKELSPNEVFGRY